MYCIVVILVVGLVAELGSVKNHLFMRPSPGAGADAGCEWGGPGGPGGGGGGGGWGWPCPPRRCCCDERSSVTIDPGGGEGSGW